MNSTKLGGVQTMNLASSMGTKASKGFTIVELLIVIIVIAVLAAITVVTYRGVQERAKTTQSLSNATDVRDTANAYYGDTGGYPTTLAALTASTNSVPISSSITVLSNGGNPATPVTSLTSANGRMSVQYDIVTASTAGARIVYWDFSTNKPSTNILYLGTATAASSFSTTP